MNSARPDTVGPLPVSRLFIALWPSPDVRTAISALAAPWLARLPGRPLAAADLHLTLHFLGQPGEEIVGRISSLVRGWPRPAFRLLLCRYGQFERAGVVWLGPARTPAALRSLHDELGRALPAVGCELERREFQPHVTLARAVRQPASLPVPHPVEWPVDDLVLAGSVPAAPGEARYRVLARAGDGSGDSGPIRRSAGRTDL